MVADVSENAAIPLPTGGGGAGVGAGGGGAGGGGAGAGGGGAGLAGGGDGVAGGGVGVPGGGVGDGPAAGGGVAGAGVAAVSLPPQPASTVLAAAVNSRRRRFVLTGVRCETVSRDLGMSNSAWTWLIAADDAEQGQELRYCRRMPVGGAGGTVSVGVPEPGACRYSSTCDDASFQ